MKAVARLVLVLGHVISGLCVLAFGAFVVFDAQTERLTAGLPPRELSARLDGLLASDYDDVTGIAHNAGDALDTAVTAVAYSVDGIEIDVRQTGDGLFATHDALVPLLEDIAFRGPSLRAAWNVARLRSTVLLHFKERSPSYLSRVNAFLSTHTLPRVMVQSKSPATLQSLRRAHPGVTRLLLVFTTAELKHLQRDPGTLAAIDGVSVRESLLTPEALAALQRRQLLVYAWTVNDVRRLNELVTAGIDGVITERLDIMRLLGTGAVAP
jgi:glycerophosphoryl diester phosphodiesterase